MIPFESPEQLESEGWDEEQLKAQAYAIGKGLDLSYSDATQWRAEQMDNQMWAVHSKLDLMGIDQALDWAGDAPKREDGRRFIGLDPSSWTFDRMYAQRLALSQGFDLSGLDTKGWGWRSMQTQRLALAAGGDLSHLDPTNVSEDEMDALLSYWLEGNFTSDNKRGVAR